MQKLTQSGESNLKTVTGSLGNAPFHFNAIALREAKIVYNFGLSVCDRVNIIKYSPYLQLCHILYDSPYLVENYENSNKNHPPKFSFICNSVTM